MTIPKLVRWSFAAFAASLPFEAGFSLAADFSLAKFAALIFLGSYFLYHNSLFAKRPFPPMSACLWCFCGFAAVYLVNGVFQNQLNLGLAFFLRLTQLLLLFWVSSSLLQNDEMARNVLVAYAFGAVALAVGTLFEIPGLYRPPSATGRVFSLGQNPSVEAFNLVLGATIFVGFNLDTRVRPLLYRMLLLVLTLLLLGMAVRTGARSGSLAFLLVMVAYLLPIPKSAPKLRALILVVLTTGAMLYAMTLYPALMDRIQTYYDKSQTGKPEWREIFIDEALHMFIERPILGNLNYMEEFGIRTGFGEPMDTHNLYLHVLLEVGLLGSGFLFAGIWLCLRSAWKARSGTLGMLPFAMMTAALTMNFVNTELIQKPFWLVLALGIAAGTERKPVFLLVRRSLARTR